MNFDEIFGWVVCEQRLDFGDDPEHDADPEFLK